MDNMANTYSHCYNHIVFSTKNRINLIHPDIENRVWAYIGGIARKHNLTALQVGGIDNHIHVLISSPPSVSPSQIAQWIKGATSHWIHSEFPELKGFAWQDGYGVFSVCKSHSQKVIDYIKNQREHHKRQTFEEEYVELLRLHGIEYDERYLFG
jgi:REP element-mobilizing transposase RayT